MLGLIAEKSTQQKTCKSKQNGFNCSGARTPVVRCTIGTMYHWASNADQIKGMMEYIPHVSRYIPTYTYTYLYIHAHICIYLHIHAHTCTYPTPLCAENSKPCTVYCLSVSMWHLSVSILWMRAVLATADGLVQGETEPVTEAAHQRQVHTGSVLFPCTFQVARAG